MKTYKQKCLDEIYKMIKITSDECCDECEVCGEDNNCVLTRINNGLCNIYGNNFVGDD